MAKKDVYNADSIMNSLILIVMLCKDSTMQK